jgi:cysteate synthase
MRVARRAGRRGRFAVNGKAAVADRYFLKCYACSREYADDGVLLRCTEEHEPAFLRTVYRRREFAVDDRATGLLRYADWLPLRSPIQDVGRTVAFSAEALNRFLRADNLWIAFNGYWPERGALLPTSTFKDLEAAGILGRFPRDGRMLVAASAGNTAAALARACGEYGVPAAIVAPQHAIASLRFDQAPRACVQFVSVSADSTYDDAIALAKNIAAADDQLVFEGGAANAARRDAIATTLLAAVERLGRLPEYYVQAVGSGAGAIAAYEAARRLLADGRYGSVMPHFMLVQNAPSTPIHDAWKTRRPALCERADAETERAQSRSIAATVLGTRTPPYSIAGGLHSILTESAGDVAAVSNDDVAAAAGLFEELVGIDVEPAGAVALAGLRHMLNAGTIDPHATILLHVTGGGRKRRGEALHYGVERSIDVDRRGIADAGVLAGVHARLFALHD